MAMRLTGLMSGMDTESIIQELVAVKSTKVDTARKAQTKLEWKQEAWKTLNTKLKNLQSKFVSDMRYQGTYKKKTTEVSNTSAVSVITSESAVNSVQELKVTQLAKTAYLTGGVVSAKDGSEVTAETKVSDLVSGGGEFPDNATITLTQGGNTTAIQLTKDTTISDVLNQLQGAGLNASFDSKNKRFFVSAKSTGEANDFSLNAYDEKGATALQAMGLQVATKDAEGNWSAVGAEYQKYAAYVTKEAGGNYALKDDEATKSWLASETDSRVNQYLTSYQKLLTDRDAAKKSLDELNNTLADKYKDKPLEKDFDYTTAIADKQSEIAAKQEAITSITDEQEKAEAEKELKTLQEELADLTARKTDAEALKAAEDKLAGLEKEITDGAANVTVTEQKDENGNITGYEVTATEALKAAKETEAKAYCLDKAAYAAKIVNGEEALTASAVKTDGRDAVIQLNGAEFTGSTNVFEINGLTITALAPTAADETVTITTKDDVDGIYDMIKDFLKEYNSIINELDKLYNADGAKGYEPLTDDEKESMSESEIEKYEQKIKDGLFRRDSDVSAVADALKSAMSSGYTVNGKTMYLSNFGINTLGYFTAADNEKNAYYIDGDPDSASTSGNEDKLKYMITTDADTVVSFFTSLSAKMYDSMSNLTKSVDGYRSYGNFYDDKKMKSDYDDYKTKIAELEEKLNDYEDKWYAKFSAMETAMAKMQSNANAVTSLLGG